MSASNVNIPLDEAVADHWKNERSGVIERPANGYNSTIKTKQLVAAHLQYDRNCFWMAPRATHSYRARETESGSVHPL